jgi:hypothetical protein
MLNVMYDENCEIVLFFCMFVCLFFFFFFFSIQSGRGGNCEIVLCMKCVT